MPNGNIPETETIKLVRTYQEKGRPRQRWIDNNREDMKKYELIADMTNNRQDWKMMLKTGTQRSGDGL